MVLELISEPNEITKRLVLAAGGEESIATLHISKKMFNVNVKKIQFRIESVFKIPRKKAKTSW